MRISGLNIDLQQLLMEILISHESPSSKSIGPQPDLRGSHRQSQFL
jgi:hypothetical protein